MRDERPLVRDVVVHDGHALVVAVVLPGHLRVQLVERLAGDRLALLRHLVHAQLELGELGLAEHRDLDAFQIVAQQRQLRRIVLDVLEHVVDQQRLVERRRDLGDEDRVRRGGERLRLVRVVALHRVPELVGQRADVVVLAVVVQQHERVDVVGAAVRVGAGALAFVGQQIDPALLEGAGDDAGVVGAERRERRRARASAPPPACM